MKRENKEAEIASEEIYQWMLANGEWSAALALRHFGLEKKEATKIYNFLLMHKKELKENFNNHVREMIKSFVEEHQELYTVSDVRKASPVKIPNKFDGFIQECLTARYEALVTTGTAEKHKKQKRQQFGWKEIEQSGISCRECRYFKDGTCSSKAYEFNFTKAEDYHICLQPKQALLEAGINHMREYAAVVKSVNRKGMYAVIDRYEGSPRKQVCRDYGLYSPGRKMDNYSIYVKRGVGELTPYASVLECAAIAKWVLDDMETALLSWNPFEHDIEKIKTDELRSEGLKMIGCYVELDGNQYRVIDQEKGNLFVVADKCVATARGFSDFEGSSIEEYLNGEWLEQNPEVSKRLLHKVKIPTQKAQEDYDDRMPGIEQDYWVNSPYRELPDGYCACVDAITNAVVLKCSSYELGIRPAFWIVPSNATIDMIKTRITKEMNRKQKKEALEMAVVLDEPQKIKSTAVFDLPAGSISQLLNNLAESCKQVRAMQVEDDEREVLDARILAEKDEIWKMSKLSPEDFELLCEVRGIN